MLLNSVLIVDMEALMRRGQAELNKGKAEDAVSTFTEALSVGGCVRVGVCRRA